MRGLETLVGQKIQGALQDSLDVRVAEQLNDIPKDKVCVVNLDTKRQKDPALIDVFENTFKIELRMRYGDATENEMEIAGKAIHFALINPHAWQNNNDVLHFSLQEVKKFISDNYWRQEFSYMIVAVDKES